MTGLSFRNGVAHFPFIDGKYSVGNCDIMSIFSSNYVDNANNNVQHRSLMMRLYYPTSTKFSSTSNWLKWLPSLEYAEGYVRFKYGKVWCSKLLGRFLRWFVYDPFCPFEKNATLAELSGEQKFPVVIFSHGLGGCRTTYSQLCGKIAASGFVVAALEHTDGTACVTPILVDLVDAGYDDNVQWIYERKVSLYDPEVYTKRNAQLKQRVAEVEDALEFIDILAKGLDYPEPLKKIRICSQFMNGADEVFLLSNFCGRLDMNKPIVAGHSFGGATVIATMASSNRFQIGVAFDSWLSMLKDHAQQLCEQISNKINSVNEGLLFVNCENFQFSENLTIMEKFRSIGEIVTLKKAEHLAFSDIPILTSQVRKMLNFLFLNLFTNSNEDVGLEAPGTEEGLQIGLELFLDWVDRTKSGLNQDIFSKHKHFLLR